MADLKDVSTGAVALESPAMDSLSVTGDLTVDTNTLYVDSTSNRVGIGNASPATALDVTGTITSDGLTVDGTGGQITTDNNGFITSKQSLDVATAGGRFIGKSNRGELGHIAIEQTATGADGGYIRFSTSPSGSTSPTERMRIDSSGDVLMGATSTVSLGGINPKLIVQSGTDGMAVQEIGNGYIAYTTKPSGAHSYYAGFFMNSSTTSVGSIFCTTSSTAYNTSSDYRLKTAVTYDWDATTRLKQLRPARFEWIADGDDAVPVDGFLAHEVEGIVPEAIHGTHDGMRDEEYEVTPAVLDEDGNEVTPAVMGTRSVPDYQGIDQSKLTPLLTKALIEAVDKIEQLEARITALEAN